MTPDLSKLDELHERATPGPWRAAGGGPTPRQVMLKRAHWRVGSDSTDTGIALVFGDDEANAALIVALRNAYPALSAELRELRGAVETYRHAAKLASFWFDKLQRGEPFDRAMFDEDAESIYRTVACDGDPTEMEKARAALSAAPKPETDCPIHGAACGGTDGDCPRC